MIVNNIGAVKNKFDYIWNLGIDVDFNDLPKYNTWSNRLLGLVDWFRIDRSPEELEREFEKDTYIPQYQYAQSNTNLTDVFELSQQLYKTHEICCVHKGNFRLLSFFDALMADVWIVLYYLTKFTVDAKAIVDIGAGNGSVIISAALSGLFPNVEFYALDHMLTAQKIVNLLSERNGCKVITGDCNLLDKSISKYIPEGAVLYTNYVLHELTHHPKDIVERICALKPSVVLNFEPFVTFCNQETLYGQMCARYLDINKYNTTFDHILKKCNGKTIDIVYEESNLFGKNPYLPKSLIVWKPRYS